MLVREIMTRDVTSLQDTDAMLDAAMIFARTSLRHLPVLHETALVGILTERDFKRFAPGLMSGVSSAKYNELMESTPIGKVMSRNPMTLQPDQDVAEAAQLFATKRFGCLPVVEGDKLVGIVTTTDMLRLMAQMMKKQKAGR